MSTDELHIVGGSVTDDPAIKAKIAAYENKGQEAIAEALTNDPSERLKVHGITLRKPNLKQAAILWRLMKKFEDGTGGYDMAADDQLFIWIFTLVAPLEKVFFVTNRVEKESKEWLQARIHEWWEEAGISTAATKDLMETVIETFQLTEKMFGGKGEKDEPQADGTVIKKNVYPGTSSPSTP
jgi:hypothetical protein